MNLFKELILIDKAIKSNDENLMYDFIKTKEMNIEGHKSIMLQMDDYYQTLHNVLFQYSERIIDSLEYNLEQENLIIHLNGGNTKTGDLILDNQVDEFSWLFQYIKSQDLNSLELINIQVIINANRRIIYLYNKKSKQSPYKESPIEKLIKDKTLIVFEYPLTYSPFKDALNLESGMNISNDKRLVNYFGHEVIVNNNYLDPNSVYTRLDCSRGFDKENKEIHIMNVSNFNILLSYFISPNYLMQFDNIILMKAKNKKMNIKKYKINSSDMQFVSLDEYSEV